MRHILLAVVSACTLTSCGAEDKTTASSPSPTMLDKLTSLGRHAERKAVELADSTKPRKVARGAQPEIIINRHYIRINDQPIALAQPLSDWKKVLPGTARCDDETGPTKIMSCMWDDLGIYLLEYRSTVFEFNIFFYLSPWSDSESVGADGTVYPPDPDWRPKKPYTGYFEMDGYGIDAQITFRQISGNVDPNRGLHCGRIDDCSIRRGRHFNGKERLSFSTTRGDSEGQLKEFSIYTGQTDYSGPPPPSECIADSVEAKMTGCTPLENSSTSTNAPPAPRNR